MVDWDKYDAQAQDIREANALFVSNPKDGQEVRGIVCGEPHAFEAMFDKGWFPYDENKTQDKAKFIMFVNFYHDKSQTMKILVMGEAMFQGMKEVLKEHPGKLIKIKREGTGPNTTYKALPVAQDPNNSTEKAKKVKLHNLAEIAKADYKNRPGPNR